MAAYLHLATPGRASALARPPVRVALAEGHTGMRRTLRLLIDREPDLEVIAEAADIDAAADHVRMLRPRVLVLDFRLPGEPCLEIIHTLRAQVPETEIVVLSMDTFPAFARQAIDAGAIGFVLKDSADSDLPAAVRAAARGDEFVSPSVAEGLALMRAVGDGLSLRETEILRLIAMGHTSQAIGQKLGLSRRTIETQKTRVYQKLGLQTRAELVSYALGRHLLGD